MLVGGENFWHSVKGQPKIVVAPDTIVIVGLPSPPDTRTMGSYRQWEFGGHVALAIEVLSPGNTWAEMVRKRQFYDRHGAAEAGRRVSEHEARLAVLEAARLEDGAP